MNIFLLTPTDHQNTSLDVDTSYDEKNIDPTEHIKEAITGRNLAVLEKIIAANSDVLDSVFDYTLPGDNEDTKGLTPLMLAAALAGLR